MTSNDTLHALAYGRCLSCFHYAHTGRCADRLPITKRQWRAGVRCGDQCPCVRKEPQR